MSRMRALFRKTRTSLIYFTPYEQEHGLRNPDPISSFIDCYSKVQWVYSCVWAIASFAAMVPFKLYRRKGDGELEELDRAHPACALFENVNPFYTRYQLWEALIAYLELTGVAYILKVNSRREFFDYDAPPDELWIIHPARVTAIPSNDSLAPAQYEVQLGHGQKRRVNREALAAVRYFNPNSPLCGQGSVHAIQGSIASDYYAQIYNVSLLKNQARPFGAIKVSGFLTDEQREQLRNEWDKVHKGVAKSGRPAILSGDVDWIDMSKTPHDIEFAELRKMSREEIIAAFGLFPAVLGLPTANYATAREQRRMFAENTMVPKLTLIQEAITQFILRDFGEDIIGTFDLSAVPALKDDEERKAKIATMLVEKRILTPNEARQLYYKLEPYDGGDDVLALMTLIPVGTPPPEKGQKSIHGRNGGGPQYTPQQSRRWLKYVRRIKTIERQAERWIREMFDKQEAEILKALRRSRRDLDDVIDSAMLAEIAAPVVKRVLVAAAEEGIKHGKEPLEFLAIDFSLESPELVAWLESHAAEAVTQINRTTQQLLNVSITEAIANGESIKQIESRIHEVFDRRRRNAHTIARTETLRGVQTTQHMLWGQSQVVEKKEWIASMAPNMRPEHGAIHGEQVKLNEPFSIGVMFPGDPDGDPSMTINCLCDMAPVVSAKAQAEYMCSRIEKWWLPPVTGEGSRRWQIEARLKQQKR